MDKNIETQITKLSNILENEELFEFFSKKIECFSCRNEDVKTFLIEKAISYERRGKSRTYIIFDKGTGDILAYFTLSLKSIQFKKGDVSKSIIKDIDGFSKDVDSVAVILIGQLGKNSNYNNAINGKEILKSALNSVYDARDIVGGRVCLLETMDTENNKKVIQFYMDNGFKVLQHDKTDKYLQMFIKL